MLLHIENTDAENLKKLMDFASHLNLHLQPVDESATDFTMPGKPLTDQELKSFIENSKKSGSISMTDAHNLIRKRFNAG